MTNAVPQRVRIATRESRLALRQSEMVAAALRERHPGLAVEFVGMTTKGDRVLDRPLAQVGGKGLFVKELESALDDGRADIAVHSLKDVPMVIEARFSISTFGPREDPFDAFCSQRHRSLDAMPAGSVVGTSSLRRECQLRSLHPRLQFRPLRGNVNTRLAKLEAGEYDAIILAMAGLRRLGLEAHIRARLDDAIPAIGQGILGVEHLASRTDLSALLAPFQDPHAASEAQAERALGLVVEGSCEVPVGAIARAQGNELTIDAFIGLPDGTRIVRDRAQGSCATAASIGTALGERLLAAGGRDILRLLARQRA
ncbi:MAG: hydroxymethylbilane synthase [Usitatibacter sp.]